MDNDQKEEIRSELLEIKSLTEDALIKLMANPDYLSAFPFEVQQAITNLYQAKFWLNHAYYEHNSRFENFPDFRR